MTERSDAGPVLAGLTRFQRVTVAHVLDRFYSQAPTRRFLIADETGLGKSMVARGVIAGAIEKLQDDPDIDRIDVVYVCSNTDIAEQNLRRLNVTGEEHLALTSRLTLMAKHAQHLTKPRVGSAKPVNLVAFTPGTSFASGHSSGRAEERALLHLLLVDILDLSGRHERASAKLLQGGVGDIDRFRARIATLRRKLPGGHPDPTVAEEHSRELKIRRLDERYLAELDGATPRKRVGDDERRRLRRLVGDLWAALAKAGVDTLEPDLVILDEFQRFRDLLDVENGGPAAELAHHLFDHGDARVLLLSATPYKPFTYAEESLTGDDHSRDFLKTLEFLTDGDTVAVDDVRADLRAFRSAAVTGQDPAPAASRLRTKLIKVMSRVERPQFGRDAMLSEHAGTVENLTAGDLVGYAALRALAEQVGAQMSLEYWKSAPYFVNFLDGYQLGEHLRATLKDPDERRRLAPLVASTSRIDRGALDRHDEVDLGNAKLRALAADTVGRGWWKLLWVPPSLPYLRPSGVYGELDTRSVTKRVVFSSWAGTPTAVASLLSHEAARHVGGGMKTGADGARTVYTPRLQYTVTQGRLTGMPTFALFAPNPALGARCDPLAMVGDGDGSPIDEDDAESRCAELLGPSIGPDGTGRSTANDAWYWAALLGLDRAIPRALAHDPDAIAASLSGHAEEASESRGALIHAEHALELHARGEEQTERPADLGRTCAQIGLHAPGTTAWRALARQLPTDHEVTAAGLWRAAALIGDGFRSLFNRPETIALLDQVTDEATYWRAVLRNCAWGNLQAVLDEYLHHLAASRGTTVVDDAAVIELAGEVRSAIALRPSTYQAFDPERPDEVIRLPSRFALRYGSKRHSEDDVRLPEVRRAFNSPFWPFALATTSVGQEGIDLHWWCHSVLHWNTPANPVDFEQREGPIHRYGGHAIRRNVAAAHGPEVLCRPSRDPWATAYRLAAAARPDLGELAPHWVYPGPATVERHVAPYPLSSDRTKLERLKTDVALYRLTFGQPRQEDLLALLRRHGSMAEAGEVDALRIDLRPPTASTVRDLSIAGAVEGAPTSDGLTALLAELPDG